MWQCVYGASGVGKSALCLAAAHRMVVRRRFPVGVLHVGLADATSPAAFVHALLKGIEDAKLPHRQVTFELRVSDAISALVDGLQGEGTLLILDDVEPLLRTCGGRQAVRDVVVGALKKLPNLRVVLSCQHLLPIAHCAQSEIQLSPLNPTCAAIVPLPRCRYGAVKPQRAPPPRGCVTSRAAEPS